MLAPDVKRLQKLGKKESSVRNAAEAAKQHAGKSQQYVDADSNTAQGADTAAKSPAYAAVAQKTARHACVLPVKTEPGRFPYRRVGRAFLVNDKAKRTRRRNGQTLQLRIHCDLQGKMSLGGRGRRDQRERGDQPPANPARPLHPEN